MVPTGGQTRSKCGWFLELVRRSKIFDGNCEMWSAGHAGAERLIHALRARSEAIIHADPQQTRLDAVIGAGQDKWTIVQVDVEVFRSGGPVARQRNLDTETACPARAGAIL